MTEITGTVLRELRHKADMSLTEVEKATSISSSYLSQLENEKAKNPTYKLIMGLLDLYNVKVQIDFGI